MSVIEEVHLDRQDLARVLKKHPGIRKIVEDLYPDSAHFIYELLQNAEDTGATQVSFTLSESNLTFEHNGRAFKIEDIYAITDIGEGTKANDEDKIGRFGVGFKAVFAYSETPHIWSPTFSFKIIDLVLPSEIPADPDLGPITRFEFPFNNPKKSSVHAHKEVESGLNELAETTLLFLTNIESIKWRAAGSSSGEILRVHHSEAHVEVLKNVDGGSTTSAHFLKFDQPVDGLEKQRTAIAYALDFLPNISSFSPKKQLATQLRIVGASPGQVAVFFPANKEASGLRFHLHAPFVPELSRASIKEVAANVPLFSQLASLAAASLHQIRDLGLLTSDFLGVLPNPLDVLGGPYVCIRNAIVEAMRNEALTPTLLKNHAPAKYLFQAKAALKDLLSDQDIEFLISYEAEPPRWAANRALQGTHVERFMNGLNIPNWDVAEFVECIEEATDKTSWTGTNQEFMTWLGTKSLDWHQQFYALLFKEADGQSKLYRLKQCKIVRMKIGEYSAGADCFFPDEKRQHSDVVPCVDIEIYTSGKSKAQQEDAKAFLEKIGVREIGERQLIEAILDNLYKSSDRKLDEKEYLSHIRRFIKHLDENPSSVPIFAQYYLFVGSDNCWHKPAEIYVDEPYQETGLGEYCKELGYAQKYVALANFYQALPIDTPKIAKFAEKVGARTQLDIIRTSCQNNPQWDYLRSVAGERYTRAIDRDYTIDRLPEILGRNSRNLSRLIWNTMCSAQVPSHAHDSTYDQNALRSTYQKSERGGARFAHSQLVHQLRAAAWVPQKESEFVRPAEARAELLPEGFTFDAGWAWIKAVEFGKKAALESAKAVIDAASASTVLQKKQAAAKELGFSDIETVDRLRKLASIPVAELSRFVTEWENRRPVELPDHKPTNPGRRSERVFFHATQAPDRRTEERTRSVSVGREEVKAEADHYLQQQYTNSNEELICQICKDVMPFKLDTGHYYFEAVELMPSLKNRHYQNYLCLCPNHSAMFKYANGSQERIREKLLELHSNELNVVIAQDDATIYFTKTHVADLQVIILADRVGENGTDEETEKHVVES